MGNIEHIITTIIYIFVGIMILGISISILKFKNLKLINGYKEYKVKDKESLAKWFGICLLILGTSSVLTGILILFIKSLVFNLIWFNVILNLPIVIILLIGYKKHMK